MRSFPWDSTVVSMGDDGFPIYDRSYTAEDWHEVYKTFFSNGIFLTSDDDFQVAASGEGIVIVNPGKTHINGVIGWEVDARSLALQAAGTNDRIDTVVLRWDSNVEARSIDLYIKKGVESPSASVTPTRPVLTRSETVYELGLADVYIPANLMDTSNQRITDTRRDTTRCGIVTPYSDAFSKMIEEINTEIDNINDDISSLETSKMNKRNVIDLVFPVGSIYMSYTNVSPASRYGGTWTQITGRYIRASNDVGTGGADNVTLTTAQMPVHTHTQYSGNAANPRLAISAREANGYGLTQTAGFINRAMISTNATLDPAYNGNTGSGNSHSNMPAYQNLYIWRRTA